jgi:hypothetical protein
MQLDEGTGVCWWWLRLQLLLLLLAHHNNPQPHTHAYMIPRSFSF